MTDQPKRIKTGGRKARPGNWRRCNVTLPEEVWQELGADGRTYGDGIMQMRDELHILRRALDQLAAALPDGIAVLMDLKQEATSTPDYFDRRTEQLMDILRTIRKNPDEYDPERPNGKEDRRRH